MMIIIFTLRGPPLPIVRGRFNERYNTENSDHSTNLFLGFFNFDPWQGV